MSFHILIVFLFVAFSCKSEVKPISNEVDEITNNEQVIPSTNSDDSQENKETAAVKLEEKATQEEKKQPTKGNSTTPTIEDKVAEVVKENIETKPVVKDNSNTESKKDPVRIETKTNEEDAPKEIETEKPSKPEISEKFVGFPSHSIFDGLLKAHVSSAGVVDYKGLKAKESTLDQYLAMLEANAPGTTWSREQELAYWINAYNGYTIKLILKNYPVNSITDLNGGKPWDVKWIKLDGKTLSLNNIENDIIRPKYNEPRIHFAVNCAAKSCPPILNEAYKEKSLEAQLESQTKKFINNSSHNTLGKTEIKVSKIFDWYGADFGDVAAFVMRYAGTTVKPSAKVSFMEYDWSLNGK